MSINSQDQPRVRSFASMEDAQAAGYIIPGSLPNLEHRGFVLAAVDKSIRGYEGMHYTLTASPLYEPLFDVTTDRTEAADEASSIPVKMQNVEVAGMDRRTYAESLAIWLTREADMRAGRRYSWASVFCPAAAEQAIEQFKTDVDGFYSQFPAALRWENKRNAASSSETRKGQ